MELPKLQFLHPSILNLKEHSDILITQLEDMDYMRFVEAGTSKFIMKRKLILDWEFCINLILISQPQF